jgi:hypothetical protein
MKQCRVKVSFPRYPNAFIFAADHSPNTSVSNTDFKFTEVESEATAFTTDIAFLWARFVFDNTGIDTVTIIDMEA